MTKIRHLAAILALLLMGAPALGQIPGGGGDITIGTTPIQNGTNGLCLYDNAGIVGEQSCAGVAADITVGTTLVNGGTSGRILFDNAGVLGEKVVTGTGNAVLQTSPTLVTPLLGTPTSGTLTNTAIVLGKVTMTLGSDADGDIYYRASNVLTRLGIGTNGQCLLTNAGATAPEWGSCGGGGGSPGGSDTQVQFNDSSAFGGDSGLTFNKTTNLTTMTGTDGASTLSIVGGTQTGSSSPALSVTQTWNAAGTTFTGLKLAVTNTASAAGSLLMDLQFGGTSQFSVAKTGKVLAGDGTNTVLIRWGGDGNRGMQAGSGAVQLTNSSGTVFAGANSGGGGWNVGTSGSGANFDAFSIYEDVYLQRDAANIFAQRNSTNAQTFRVYNTFTDASNYERGTISWGSNLLTIGTQAAGTGTARNLSLQAASSTFGFTDGAGNTASMTLLSAGRVQFGSTLYATTLVANAVDFSTSGGINMVQITSPTRLSANGEGLVVASGRAIPAGGTAGTGYAFSSTANFGMFFGSGAPSLAAAQGSIYLRSDGTGSDSVYTNTNGSTTWAAVGGSGSPGGSDTQVQFNDSSAFGGDAGFVYNKTTNLVTLTGTDGASSLLIASGSQTGASSPALSITQTWNAAGTTFTGILANFTNTTSAAGSLLLDLQVGATSQFKVARLGGDLTLAGNTSSFVTTIAIGSSNDLNIGAGKKIRIADSGSITMVDAALLRWTNNASDPGSGVIQVVLVKDGLGILAQRNSTDAQTFRVYNTFTDASNYERANLTWGSNFFTISTTAAGTGTARSLGLNSGANINFTFPNGNSAVFVDGATNIVQIQSNYFGILQNGAIFVIGGGNDTSLTRASAGVFRIGDGGANANGSLSLAGLTSTGTVTMTLATDATHTTRTVCQDTGSNVLFFGSGTVGICLGTSSARYKTNIAALKPGLTELVKLEPKTFLYKKGYGDNGAKQQVGFLAEDVVKVLPSLVGLDAEGKPNSVDLVGMIPTIIKAITELKADNDNLRNQLRTKRAAN